MTARTLVKGFDKICSDAKNQEEEGTLCWYCAPDSWEKQGEVEQNKREGRGGRWSVDVLSSSPKSNNTTTALTLHPPAKKDFWRKTYYQPILVKDDGPFLYHALDAPASGWSFTMETRFRLSAHKQFDQAGLLVRMDQDHWLKTGIEVVDQLPRLSCVVTNVYSDWSTQPWPQHQQQQASSERMVQTDGAATEPPASVQVECAIRVHCRGSGNHGSFVVEAKQGPNNAHGEDGDGKSSWSFVRIAQLSKHMVCPQDPLRNHPAMQAAWTGPSPETGVIWAGVFACCPEDQKGGKVTFHHFEIREGSSFDHNADGNAEE